MNNIWSQICISFTGSPPYEGFLGIIICHSLLYFAILTYINKCPAPTSKKKTNIRSGLRIFFGFTVYPSVIFTLNYFH